jgi:hypothetical protein
LKPATWLYQWKILKADTWPYPEKDTEPRH